MNKNFHPNPPGPSPSSPCRATAGAIFGLLQRGHHQPQHGAGHGGAEGLGFGLPHGLRRRFLVDL